MLNIAYTGIQLSLAGCEKLTGVKFIPSHFPYTVFAVILYHIGCYAEYKLGIEDTARVVPVHGIWYIMHAAQTIASTINTLILDYNYTLVGYGVCYQLVC